MSDHRAAAERWLAKTEQLVGPNEDDETMTILLAIGHALLAQQQPINVVKVSGNPTAAEIDRLRAELRL